MKYRSYVLLFSLFFFLSAQAIKPTEPFKNAQQNHKKHIALIIAFRDYQPYEYSETKRVLMHNGFSITTFSTQPGLAKAADGSIAKVDQVLHKLKPEGYDAIVLIGGPGAHTELDRELTYSIMRNAYNAGKVVAAICYSPRILAKAGVLKGKKATGWNDDNKLETLFNTYGAIYTHTPAVIDGKIVTADGPAAATDFGKAIGSLLSHKQKGE